MAGIYIDQDSEIRFLLFCKNPSTRKSERGICGAQTRKRLPCKAPPVWDKTQDKARNGRCKLHGGYSTGPKTGAGREAIRASNRRRKKTP